MPHKTATPPAAYSYLRFSSPQQAEGDTLRRQTDLRDAWVKKAGAVLDTSVTMKDEGVSAFTGKHRENPDRNALAAFLELVKRGRVPRGSYLIVESLDRLSREHIRPALTLLLNLIDAGVRVVQLLPVEAVYDEQVEPMNLMMAIMELSRGHSESKVKSQRLSAAWGRKKAEAVASKKPITRSTPAWLRVAGGRFEVIKSRADAVRLIYRLAVEGHGIGAITRRLNGEGVEPIGKAPHWARGYVARLLSTRLTLGEYQPCLRPGGKPTPAGPPVPGYYPAIVSEDVWHAAQAAVASRHCKGGRPGKRAVNLFAGLLRDARTGGNVWALNTGGGRGTMLTAARGVIGQPEADRSRFPLPAFERAVLSRLQEIDPREILPGDGSADKVLTLAGRLADVEGRLERVQAQLVDGDDELPALVEAVRKLEDRRKAAADALAAAREEAASPLSEAWAECQTLAEALDRAPDPADARVRLRATLRRIVEGVWCLFIARGVWRFAAVRIQFAGGAHRDYVIAHRQAYYNQTSPRPAQTEVCSFADVAPAARDIDLRRKKDVALAVKLLEAIDPAELASHG
jgi:DNA invertase Pin-like site-specific DNA recombinase